MFRIILAASALQLALATTAVAACDGQPGKVIFEDDFTDDSGGWDINADVMAIKPPHLIGTLSKDNTGYSTHNLTFSATDGDFCADAALPKSPASDNTASAGLEFWASDYDNFYEAEISSDGTAGLYQKSNGKWSTIFQAPSGSTGVKTAPGSVNAIHVITKNGKISFSVNGTALKVVRAQVPDGRLRFGVFVGVDKTPPQPVSIQFNDFKVTEGQ